MTFEELKNMGAINHLETLERDGNTYESYEVNTEKFCIILKYKIHNDSYDIIIEYIEEIYINGEFDKFNFISCMNEIIQIESKDMNHVYVYKRIEDNL